MSLKPEDYEQLIEIGKSLGVSDMVLPGQDVPVRDDKTQTKDESCATDSNKTDIVDDYIAELVLDLVTRKHVKLGDLNTVRSVFRNVLKNMSDGEPHTFAEIRSTISVRKRDYVSRILTKLTEKRVIVRTELNHRIFYRISLDLLSSVHQYVVNTMERGA